MSILATAAFTLFGMTSCMQEKPVPSVVEEEPVGLLSIGSLSVEDFVGDASTRALNDGVTVTFENGDELGVLLIDKEGKAFENVLFRYDNGTWFNTAGRYYSSGINRALAYFPYHAFSDGQLPSTVAELKEAVSGLTPASADFSDRDLLTAELTEISSPELAITFGHAYSLIVLSGEKFLNVGEETFSCMISLTDVALSIGDRLYEAEEVGGRYLVLLDDVELKPQEFRYFYTVNGNSYVKTVKETMTLMPNHSYSFPCVTAGGGAETDIEAGDFYCTSASGTVVVIPGDAAAVPDGLTCHGIVFYVMEDDEYNTFLTTNGIEEETLTGYEGQHGMVVSLKAGDSMFTATSGANATWDNLSAMLSSTADYTSTEVANGYLLTGKIQDAMTTTTYTFGFTALAGHDMAPSAAATSWYAPSFKELRYMFHGEFLTAGSTEGFELVNAQISKAGGVQLGSTVPSVTCYAEAEVDGSKGFRLMSNGSENGWHGVTPGEVCRPIFAF